MESKCHPARWKMSTRSLFSGVAGLILTIAGENSKSVPYGRLRSCGIFNGNTFPGRAASARRAELWSTWEITCQAAERPKWPRFLSLAVGDQKGIAIRHSQRFRAGD